jgi:hypothetical protein
MTFRHILTPLHKETNGRLIFFRAVGQMAVRGGGTKRTMLTPLPFQKLQ